MRKMLGLMTRLHNRISVRDFGLNNITDADGLAVASPSGFVGKTLEQMISGVYTSYSILLTENAILKFMHCISICQTRPILSGQQVEAWYLRIL